MYYFIDFENVHHNGLVGLDKLTSRDTVVILFPFNLKTQVCNALLQYTTEASIQLHCISTGYKDALDLKLIAKALLMYKAGHNAIAFISNDHIFVGLKDALREFNYLGNLKIAIGNNCACLKYYFHFDYGKLLVYRQIEDIFTQFDDTFSKVAAHTYQLINTVDICPSDNFVSKGIGSKIDRAALLEYISSLSEPKADNVFDNAISHCTLKTTTSSTKTITTVTKCKPFTLKANWDSDIHDFCFSFVPTIKNICKLHSLDIISSLEVKLLSTTDSQRKLSFVLSIASSFLGCRMDSLQRAFLNTHYRKEPDSEYFDAAYKK